MVRVSIFLKFQLRNTPAELTAALLAEVFKAGAEFLAPLSPRFAPTPHPSLSKVDLQLQKKNTYDSMWHFMF